MRVSYWPILLAVLFIQSCVKDEGQLPAAASNNGTTTGGTTGTTTGGTYTAPPSVPGTDPLFAQSWHLLNTGQTSYSSSGGVAGQDINVQEAHSLIYRGSGVRIAVSDTGVDITHPDLITGGLTAEHRNYIFDNSSDWPGASPEPVDGEAHGTAVTGLIAALEKNGYGSRGIAPSASWAAFRFLQEYSNTMTFGSYLAKTLDQMDGNFDIFNYSYGSAECGFTDFEDDTFAKIYSGVTTLRNGKGALYVQSAGNGYDYTRGCPNYYANTNHDSEITTPYKIIVGAVNASGVKSSYSTPGSGIWVSAPGGEFGTSSPAMVTTDIQGCRKGMSYYNPLYPSHFNFGGHADNKYCDYTNVMNGTSSAAPVTSGVIALMLEANPDLTWRDVKHILATTSDQIDFSGSNDLTHPNGDDLTGYVYDQKWVTNTHNAFLENAAGYTFSNWYGFGRINAENAVEEALLYATDLGQYKTSINPNTLTTYYDSGAISEAIPDNDNTGSANQTLTSLHNYFIEAIQIQFSTDHAVPAELAVHLTSPSGTVSRLTLINNGSDNIGLTDAFLLTNAFYGENSAGTWTINIVDGAAGNTGNLINWKLIIHGHRVDGDNVLPLAVTNLTPDNNPSLSDDTSPEFTITDPNGATDLRYEVSIVGPAPATTVLSDWHSVGLSSAFTVELPNGVNFIDGTYTVKIRVIDLDEDVSAEYSRTWTVDVP